MEWQILIALVGVLAVLSIYYWGAKKLRQDSARDAK
jgi:hypothetical protein